MADQAHEGEAAEAVALRRSPPVVGRGPKPSPECLEGIKDQRVFVGGQYDFMPTLRVIAQFIREVSSPEKPLLPVIPFDFEIRVEETMDWDIRILGQCAYAIFDLSDLGAQLVEMQEARQKHTSIRALVVYPVRERVNQPERGRRTVLSFGLPHFGYRTFSELKGIVWRFLMDVPTERDYPPRVIPDPILDREIRRSRLLWARGDAQDACQVLRDLVGTDQHRMFLEPWLQLALITSGIEKQESARALNQAENLARGELDKAEILYYRSLITRLGPDSDWKKVREDLSRARDLNPRDGRILNFLGYAHWKLKEAADAIAFTREALEAPDIPDPVTTVHALNNLACYLCEQAEGGQGSDALLDEALELTEYLPAYQQVFRRLDAGWLDTRGWALQLRAGRLADAGYTEKAKALAQEAVGVLSEASKMEAGNQIIAEHFEAARRLRSQLAR